MKLKTSTIPYLVHFFKSGFGSGDFGEKKESSSGEKKSSFLRESSSEKLVAKRAPRSSVFGDPRDVGFRSSVFAENRDSGFGGGRGEGFGSGGFGERREGGFPDRREVEAGFSSFRHRRDVGFRSSVFFSDSGFDGGRGEGFGSGGFGERREGGFSDRREVEAGFSSFRHRRDVGFRSNLFFSDSGFDGGRGEGFGSGGFGERREGGFSDRREGDRRSSGFGEKKEGGFRSGCFGEKKEKALRSGDFGEKKESSSGEKKSSLLGESFSEKLVAKRAPRSSGSGEKKEKALRSGDFGEKKESSSGEKKSSLLGESSSGKFVAEEGARSGGFGEKKEKAFGSVSSEEDEENAFGSVSSEEDNEVGFGSVTSEEDEEGGFESCGLGEKKEGGFESVTAEKDEGLVLVISMSYLQSVGSREKKFLRIVKLYREVPDLEDCFFGEKKEGGFGSGGLREKRDDDFGARREQEFGVGGFGDGKSILMSAYLGSLDADQFHWFDSTGLESDRSRFLYFPIQEIVDIVENGHCVACSWYNSPKAKFGCSFTEKFIIPFLFRFCPYCSERWCESNQCISSLLNEFVLHAEIKGPGSGYSLRS